MKTATKKTVKKIEKAPFHLSVGVVKGKLYTFPVHRLGKSSLDDAIAAVRAAFKQFGGKGLREIQIGVHA